LPVACEFAEPSPQLYVQLGLLNLKGYTVTITASGGASTKSGSTRVFVTA
jgi:hypothetical protein